MTQSTDAPDTITMVDAYLRPARITPELRQQIERYMSDPTRCMPSERARLEQAGFKAHRT